VRVRLRGQRTESGDATPAEGRSAAPSREPETQGRRSWNLWELDRLARALNGDARAEERRLLLLHLRDFADSSGQLPVEFDPLVRDVFGPRLEELS
jgi:hypothetical protein